jgi:hypothetical protein
MEEITQEDIGSFGWTTEVRDDPPGHFRIGFLFGGAFELDELLDAGPVLDLEPFLANPTGLLETEVSVVIRDPSGFPVAVLVPADHSTLAGQTPHRLDLSTLTARFDALRDRLHRSWDIVLFSDDHRRAALMGPETYCYFVDPPPMEALEEAKARMEKIDEVRASGGRPRLVPMKVVQATTWWDIHGFPTEREGVPHSDLTIVLLRLVRDRGLSAEGMLEKLGLSVPEARVLLREPDDFLATSPELLSLLTRSFGDEFTEGLAELQAERRQDDKDIADLRTALEGLGWANSDDELNELMWNGSSADILQQMRPAFTDELLAHVAALYDRNDVTESLNIGPVPPNEL